MTILDRWSLSAEDLTEVIDANPSLRGMILGYLAEVMLRKLWFTQLRSEITSYVKYDDHDRTRKGDLVLTYRKHPLIIEVKSLQTNMIKKEGTRFLGKTQCDASDRREITLPNGSRVNTTLLKVGEFDLLAVNLFAFENKWRYIFAKNKDLPRSTFERYEEADRKYLLASLIPVSWPPEPPFRDEPFSLMDEIIHERTD
jgi:hypothetical protein